jgi:chemotaxis protein methyltransferase CheR
MLLASEELVSERDFELISDLVYKHCGINLHDGKKELVQARIAKKMRVGGYQTASEYIEHVLADSTGERFADLIDALSTNLTSFFREDNHFTFLTKKFLPQLMANKSRVHNNRIRVWSAGCSSGEEPYTLAITILEALAGHGTWDVKILASDISRKVLRIGQQGVYPKQRIDKVPQQLRGKYFGEGPDRSTVTVSPNLKSMIRFNYLNLQNDWPFKGPFDFIFCRNVMIYFDKPTQERLVNRFFNHLAGGGVLFTGHSESLTGVIHKFQYVEPTIYGKP